MKTRRLARTLALGVVALALLAALTLGFAPLHRLVPHQPRTERARALLGDAPIAVAHRGWSAVAPENTLSAFRKAQELGVAFELDVSLCATGEVIVLHDDTLDRTTSGGGPVADATYAAIEQLDAGAWFGLEFSGEVVPTLGEVLSAIDDASLIDIELKTTDQRAALARAVVAELERANRTSGVFVSSFDPFLLEQVRLAEPSIVRAQLLGGFEDADLAWHDKRALQNLLLNGKAQPDMLIVEDTWLSERWQRAMQARGYPVLVWTVNDEARMRALRDRGVDGIISDQPDVALRVLSGG